MTLLERDGAAQLEAELRSRSLAWYHTHDSRRSAEGFPDYVIPIGRWILFVELKAVDSGGRLTPAQADWLLRLRGPWRMSIVVEVHDLAQLLLAVDNAKAGRLDVIGPAGVASVIVLGDVKGVALLGSEAVGEHVRPAASPAAGSPATPPTRHRRGTARARRGS